MVLLKLGWKGIAMATVLSLLNLSSTLPSHSSQQHVMRPNHSLMTPHSQSWTHSQQQSTTDLGEEHAVAEGNDEHTPWLQHAQYLPKHPLRLLEVLHADSAQHGIKGVVCQRPARRIHIQVPEEEGVQAGVARQLRGDKQGWHFYSFSR